MITEVNDHSWLNKSSVYLWHLINISDVGVGVGVGIHIYVKDF